MCEGIASSETVGGLPMGKMREVPTVQRAAAAARASRDYIISVAKPTDQEEDDIDVSSQDGLNQVRVNITPVVLVDILLGISGLVLYFM